MSESPSAAPSIACSAPPASPTGVPVTKLEISCSAYSSALVPDRLCMRADTAWDCVRRSNWPPVNRCRAAITADFSPEPAFEVTWSSSCEVWHSWSEQRTGAG